MNLVTLTLVAKTSVTDRLQLQKCDRPGEKEAKLYSNYIIEPKGLVVMGDENIAVLNAGFVVLIGSD